MTQKERIEVKNLSERFDEMNDEFTEVKQDIKHILFLLQDDAHSNSKGLVSKFNDIKREVYALKNWSRNVKIVLAFIGTIVVGVVTHIAKEML